MNNVRIVKKQVNKKKINKMKILKSFAHVLLVVVGASLLIYGLDKFDLIDPIIDNVNLGLKKIKSLL